MMSLSVIGAGYGRTGTASMKLALEQLGLGPCHHMKEVTTQLKGSDPFSVICNKQMNDINRDTILDAIYILNDLVDGLVAGTMVFENYQARFERGQFTKEGIVSVQKLCVSHLVLALCKLCEFWEEFHNIVPEEFRPKVKELASKIRKLGVKEYRNTVVAHVKDRKLSRARTQFEAMEVLNRISANNPRGFLGWLNNPKDNEYPKTVVSIVVKLRDSLRETHQVKPEEIFDR